jgi:hypothetical protein
MKLHTCTQCSESIHKVMSTICGAWVIVGFSKKVLAEIIVSRLLRIEGMYLAIGLEQVRVHIQFVQ